MISGGATAPAPIRVTIAIHALSGGGAERVAVDLADYLCNRGHDVTVLTFSGRDPDTYTLNTSVKRQRIEIRRSAKTLIHTIAFACKQSLLIRRKLKKLDTQIVVTLGEQNNVRILLASIATGIPVVISERVHPENYKIGWKWDIARRVLYPLCTSLVVQTGAVASWCQRWVRPGKIKVIPNAGRSELFFDGLGDERNDKERVVLSMGRLVDQKGFDLLITAFAQSKLAEGGWRLAIVGEGPRRTDLLRLADELGISAFVDMPGFTQTVSQQLHRATIFAFASRFEGFPNALLEAMQSGLPCVSTDCLSGPSELITDGEDGLLIPVDDEEAMARSLRLLANDEAFRKHLSASAREKAKFFAPDRIYPLWEKAILEAVRRVPPDQLDIPDGSARGDAGHG